MAYRTLLLHWHAGEDIPGVGRMTTKGEPFPISLPRLRRHSLRNPILLALKPRQVQVRTWISVADELPDADQSVLIHAPEDESEPVWIGYYDGEVWRSIDNLKLLAPVTHWQHLPEPPKGAA